jgi:xylulokinase
MKYVIGIDLGTSAVKVLLVNQEGDVCAEVSEDYPLIQERSGYSEQNPEEWVEKTFLALRQVIKDSGVDPADIEGLSYSGQMHGLVLLDQNHQVVRNAILWNDTRTTQQCHTIKEKLGDQLLQITKNPALEGFTLPKLLWVKEHEPANFSASALFLLPKDYLRYRMTGKIHSEYSDAAGTLLLDVLEKKWSREICHTFAIPETLCPPLVESSDCVGTLLPEVEEKTGLKASTKVFAGGADNACGALGAGILSEGNTLCSIGTSGVILSAETNKERDYKGKVHFFNHGKKDVFYAMGVTLAAGYSLRWFKDTFASSETFDGLVDGVENIPIGSNGLLFTPYLVGERTPHADANIRGSFIGIDGSHKRGDFVRAVMEGITFSLNESIEIFRQAGKEIQTVISIGGGAKSETWLQMQADIFNATIIKLENEQGPGMGAAILAAVGSHWFDSLEDCTEHFIKQSKQIDPVQENVEKYQKLYNVYKKVYGKTATLHYELHHFRS